MGINREVQGQLIAQVKDAIKRIDEFTYVVKSQSNGGSYNIRSTELGWKCDCPDHVHRGVKCKHIFAVEFSFALREQVKKEVVIQPINSVVCRYCNSDNIMKKAKDGINKALFRDFCVKSAVNAFHLISALNECTQAHK